MTTRNKKRKIVGTVLGMAMSVSMLAMLSACNSDTAPTAPPAAQQSETPAATAASDVNAAVAFTPGTFTASAPSYQDNPLTVEVTFEENRIVSIEVDHSDTPNFVRRALPTLPQMVLHRQSTQGIDTIASATLSSNAFLTAMNEAITAAGANPDDLVPVIPTTPLPGATFIAGQHIVETPSFEDSPMVMQVVFTQDEIVRIDIMEHGDTTTGGNWAGRVIPIIPHQVEEVQSTVGIDIVAGATTTSTSVLSLIDEAISLAGANPASLPPILRAPGEFWAFGAGGGNPARFHPGVYYASADGFGGPLTVQAIFSRGGLVRARVVDHSETDDFFGRVFPSGQGAVSLASIVEEGQTIQGLDVTAGATRTHEAFIQAVAEAVRMAGANPDEF
jgi:uncharacterized protein with FMN-binding domain